MEIKSYYVLKQNVIWWAKEKGILDHSNPIKQALKTQEEVLELQNAVLDDNKEEIIDALGDIMVTIIIQAEMQGLDLEECLSAAYNVIKQRTGKMENGLFKKDKP